MERSTDTAALYSAKRPPRSRGARTRRARAHLALACALVTGTTSGPAPAQTQSAAGSEASEEIIDVVVEREIPAVLEDVRAVLLDVERLGEWFPSTGEWRVLERAEESALVYGRQSLPWPVRDRDYVVQYTWRDQADGTFLLLARSRRAAGPEPPRGVQRVERLETEWRVRAGTGGTTSVRYHYLGALGGSLPVWVADYAWRSQTGRVIDALQAEVERRAARAERPAKAQ